MIDNISTFYNNYLIVALDDFYFLASMTFFQFFSPTAIFNSKSNKYF